MVRPNCSVDSLVRCLVLEASPTALRIEAKSPSTSWLIKLGCGIVGGTFVVAGELEQDSQPVEGTTEQPEAEAAPIPVVKPSVTREEIANSLVVSPFALPSPVAWFRAFEKWGSPRWRQFYRDTGSFTIADRHKAAMILGATMTDAYVAVESRGSQEVRNVLANVRTLEKSLGISDKMQQRHARMGELADAEQWSALRVEIAATMAEQGAVLRQQRDAPLADLLPFGMMLKTILVSCDIVKQLELSNERLAIGDVTLMVLMVRQVEMLPENTLKVRSVRDLRRCLKAVRDLWDHEPAKPVDDKVAATRKTVQDFLDTLQVNE